MMINNTCKYTCGCAHYHQVDRHLDLIGIFTHRQGARPWESGAKPCPKGPGGPFTRRLINTHLHPHQSSPSPSTRRINSLVSPRINDKANACRTQILPRRAVQRSVPWAVNGGSTLCQTTYLTGALTTNLPVFGKSTEQRFTRHKPQKLYESEGCCKGAFCVICFLVLFSPSDLRYSQVEIVMLR